ncbi:hypothetical protein GCM10007989_30590 [Devosia pacifica]|uniref:Uncharacterized protein n=1 Tax=Devosia pacifica TaxID=1335967 RepID=A0A918VXT0_9HYPH|nr:hypothetical protein [Devosia pacifica]GHA32402.1 hypothetical protein GCM10007989_30590 [Devosia pacifica]
MRTINLNIPADLFLGSDAETAQAQGHRHFTTAAAAIRFAMEQAAPVSLRGALLKSGEHWLNGDDIRQIYHNDTAFRQSGAGARVFA